MDDLIDSQSLVVNASNFYPYTDYPAGFYVMDGSGNIYVAANDGTSGDTIFSGGTVTWTSVSTGTYTFPVDISSMDFYVPDATTSLPPDTGGIIYQGALYDTTWQPNTTYHAGMAVLASNPTNGTDFIFYSYVMGTSATTAPGISSVNYWAAGTAYTAGAYVISNGNSYRATGNGTSGTNAPDGYDSSFNDGGVVWEYTKTIPKQPAPGGDPIVDGSMVWRFMDTLQGAMGAAGTTGYQVFIDQGYGIPYAIPSVMECINLPNMGDPNAGENFWIIAGPTYDSSGAMAVWSGCRVYRSLDGGVTWCAYLDISEATPHGMTVEALLEPPSWATWDNVNSLHVIFTEPMSLSSTTDLAVLAGANGLVVGSEIVQWVNVTPVDSDNREFIFTRLLRGRYCTDGYVYKHTQGEFFFVLSPEYLTPAGSSADRGMSVLYRAASAASDLSSTNTQEFTNIGAPVMPYSPCHVTGVDTLSGSTFIHKVVSWFRRDRYTDGWQSGADIPMNEDREEYSVEVLMPNGVVGTMFGLRPIDGSYQNSGGNYLGTPSITYTAAMLTSDNTFTAVPDWEANHFYNLADVVCAMTAHNVYRYMICISPGTSSATTISTTKFGVINLVDNDLQWTWVALGGSSYPVWIPGHDYNPGTHVFDGQGYWTNDNYGTSGMTNPFIITDGTASWLYYGSSTSRNRVSVGSQPLQYIEVPNGGGERAILLPWAASSGSGSVDAYQTVSGVRPPSDGGSYFFGMGHSPSNSGANTYYMGQDIRFDSDDIDFDFLDTDNYVMTIKTRCISIGWNSKAMLEATLLDSVGNVLSVFDTGWYGVSEAGGFHLTQPPSVDYTSGPDALDAYWVTLTKTYPVIKKSRVVRLRLKVMPSGLLWVASTAYTTGDRVFLTGVDALLQAYGSGTTGSSPPTAATVSYARPDGSSYWNWVGLGNSGSYPAWASLHAYTSGNHVFDGVGTWVCGVTGTSGATNPFIVTDGSTSWYYAGASDWGTSFGFDEVTVSLDGNGVRTSNPIRIRVYQVGSAGFRGFPRLAVV